MKDCECLDIYDEKREDNESGNESRTYRTSTLCKVLPFYQWAIPAFGGLDKQKNSLRLPKKINYI